MATTATHGTASATHTAIRTEVAALARIAARPAHSNLMRTLKIALAAETFRTTP